MKYPEPPNPATTFGPCMFGGEPKVQTPMFTITQMREYARRAVQENLNTKEQSRE